MPQIISPAHVNPPARCLARIRDLILSDVSWSAAMGFMGSAIDVRRQKTKKDTGRKT
jgi:hypothetical protein